MELGLAIDLALVALALGVAIGWLVGNRAAAAATERAARAAELQKLLDAVIVERDEAMRARATLEADARNFDARMAEIREAKEALSAQFSEIGNKLLAEAQESFLKRADQRFKESEATSGQKLSALLQPVHERLEKYEQTVTTLEEKRSDAFGNLAGLIESMRIGQEKVSSEAAKLVNSLRNAPKSRGRWGEQQLKNVLETCGLTENCDFQTEVSVDTEDGRMRPDVIIRIPGGRTLIIDAKVSLNAYQDAFGAVDDAERRVGLAAHAASMKAHINALGNKAYQTQFGNAPDYVIMFVPGEHFLSAALEHDPTLWDFAFDKRVLLATPTNLIAIARSVASVWQQEAIAKNARAIAELGKEMYDRLAKVADDLRKVGSGLNSAVSNFNAFANSFNGRLVVTGRKFRDLDIQTGSRELEDVAPVEALARSGDVAALLDSPRHDEPKAG
jgi:DNA recombination protein RmuC